MPSSFTWLDFSERDRRRALDAVDLFREEDTRDELGLGVVRDAIADRLFPGTSTIQTRVRYFLFIPWLYRTLKAVDRDSSRFEHRVRALQDGLRKSLVNGGEELGVIGYRAGRDVQRLPSSVYWQGLRRLGILRFVGSEADYSRQLGRIGASYRTDDGETVDGASDALWDPQLPAPPNGWLTATTFRITRDEASYLTDRVVLTAPHSLFAHLLHSRVIPRDSRFPWDGVQLEAMPPSLTVEIEHARNFSQSMHGASLLYNLMLARESTNDDLVVAYEERLAAWWEARRAREVDLLRWDRARFWALLASWGVRVPVPSRIFVNDWLAHIAAKRSVDQVLSDPSACELIRMRELALKRGRARLGNPRALNLWSGQSGAAQLDYRWGRPVRQIVEDLLGATTGPA